MYVAIMSQTNSQLPFTEFQHSTFVGGEQCVAHCAEVKITYAENAAMATQLYEVDVFMFFLKDLEAVSTNFYHDLWQSTRLHTPKVQLCPAANMDLCNLVCSVWPAWVQFEQSCGQFRSSRLSVVLLSD